jgi:hypothetical protein
MAGQLYPEPSPELAHRHRELAPDVQSAPIAYRGTPRPLSGPAEPLLTPAS